MSAITAERLRHLLDYDPISGAFLRRVAGRGLRVGQVAGSDCRGYRSIAVDGRDYRAHRLAWLYVHGRWPTGMLDHINGDRADNRIANLRECSNSENLQNLKCARRDSGSGLLGASWHKGKRLWQAAIELNGKARHLGYYGTADAAHAAYLKAKAEVHPFSTL